MEFLKLFLILGANDHKDCTEAELFPLLLATSDGRGGRRGRGAQGGRGRGEDQAHHGGGLRHWTHHPHRHYPPSRSMVPEISSVVVAVSCMGSK